MISHTPKPKRGRDKVGDKRETAGPYHSPDDIWRNRHDIQPRRFAGVYRSLLNVSSNTLHEVKGADPATYQDPDRALSLHKARLAAIEADRQHDSDVQRRVRDFHNLAMARARLLSKPNKLSK